MGKLILFILVATACSKTKIPKWNYATISPINVYAFPNSLSGSIGQVNGQIYVAAGAANGSIAVYKQDNGFKYLQTLTNEYAASAAPSGFFEHESELYFSQVTVQHNNANLYQTTLWRLGVDGIFQPQLHETQWQALPSRISTEYGHLFALLVVPQAGYQYGYVQWGYFANNSFSVQGTLAEYESMFPNETTFYTYNGTVYAVVRHGESPHTPYQTLKKFNNGVWQPMLDEAGQAVKWQGYAGLVSVCNIGSRYFAAGYHKVAEYTAWTAVWEFNPATGKLLHTWYPFSQKQGMEVGNGQMICNEAAQKLQLVQNNGPLTYFELLLRDLN